MSKIPFIYVILDIKQANNFYQMILDSWKAEVQKTLPSSGATVSRTLPSFSVHCCSNTFF